MKASRRTQSPAEARPASLKEGRETGIGPENRSRKAPEYIRHALRNVVDDFPLMAT